MRELDPSCNTLLPADPRYHIEGRRGPGPNTAASALRRPPAPPTAPTPQRPYQARTFTLTYDFDSELASRTIRNALQAVQYARAIDAKRITIIGYRGATLLSDGRTLAEIPKIAQLRAQALAGTVRELGLPKTAALVVRWKDEPQPADGITDPERRRSEIVVTP
jgi:outer membrane protein OmpA-like peptidoglycan-associated protein